MGMKSPTFERLRTVVLLVVGLFILIWNAIFGNQNMATYVVGLMLCGFPIVLNLDNLIRPTNVVRPPLPPPSPPVAPTVPEPTREPVS